MKMNMYISTQIAYMDLQMK